MELSPGPGEIALEVGGRHNRLRDDGMDAEESARVPVQLPTKYHLAINLKVAKALGLDVPMSLLLMADEQIE